MVVVILSYAAYLPTLEEIAERCRQTVPVFEADVPGLVDKTWGVDEAQGRMCSVYHFEDRISAEAYFATERFRDFVDNTLHGQVQIEFFDVAAVACARSLK